MPSAIVTTVGSAGANSYVTQAECTTYHGDRLNTSAWTGATGDNKDIALLMAARRLQDENWRGSRVNDTQKLAWPRLYVENPDSSTYDHYDSDEIPQRVKDAQCELALAYLQNTAREEDAEGAAVESFSADGVSINFGGSGSTNAQRGALPASAQRLLSGLVQGSRLVRG